MNIRNLDALRGLLAIYVLLGHVRWLLWIGHAQWMQQPHDLWAVPFVYLSAFFRFGREAVMVFFVLSGFFIHLRNAARVTNGVWPAQSMADYFGRRAHRLLPPYYFALIVTVICDVIGRSLYPTLYSGMVGDPLLTQTFRVSGYSAQSVVPALVVQPSINGYNFGSNGPLWSIAFEVVYYLLYPAWYALRRRSALLAFGVVPALSVMVGQLPNAPYHAVMIAFYPAWLAGAFLAERLQTIQASTRVLTIAAVAFAAGAVLHVMVPLLIAASVAAVLYGSAAVAGFALASPRRWTRVLEYFGMRSYTIYIVHFPFLALLAAWWIETHGARPSHAGLALVGAPLAIAFGCVCFNICERHFLHRPVTTA